MCCGRIMRMGGVPSSIEFYLDAESLLDLFAAYEPAKKDRFRQVIAEGEQNCRDTLKQIEELLAKMPGEPEAREEKNVTEAQSGAVSALSLQSHPLSPGDSVYPRSSRAAAANIQRD